jgi:hypothetical protein
MKKIFLLIILVGVLTNLTLVESVTGVYNTTSGLIYTDMVYLKTTFVNQNPTSADPGGYVDLLFKIENWGTESAENVTFELLPTYPFSLDPGVSTVNNIGTINSLQRGDNAYLIRYKMKVDKDAVDGSSQIKLKYSYGEGTSYSTQTFNVTISNPRTDFDIVVQDSTTLALANIGANTAYSVIVKIPEQKDFRVSGTSANIIGNLNAGDYTLTTFQINPIGIANVSTSGGKNLTVEISYTDTLGIRRTVQKEVSFDSISESAKSTIQASQPSTSIIGNNGLTYIIIGVVGIVVVVAFLKIRKRKKK